jgi:hypothetical protein
VSEETHQLAARPESTIAATLSIIERASRDPSVNVENMERLLAMAERMEEKRAVQEFNAAFAAMQKELPVIVAESVIPNRGKYAKFENVMYQIQPALSVNGFSLAFAQKADDKRITVVCHLRHIGGHSSETPFSVRLGGKADSDTQADCKASTTAKRNALLQALNIVVRQDVLQSEDDPHNESHETVSPSQAAQLRELCDETKSDHAKFLAFADAEAFEKIAFTRFDSLVSMLERKRR